MRIVAGEHRGRTLVAPKGQSTRPTADRVRQALFDILQHASWSPRLRGARVLDLFAGSGALGLESLSRGAAFCLFVDSSAAAREAIADNLAALRLADRAEVRADDAIQLATRPPGSAARGSFDLAFLDPPYGKGLAEAALARLSEGAWLADGAVAVVERGAAEADPLATGYELMDTRFWGAARVAFLLWSPPPR